MAALAPAFARPLPRLRPAVAAAVAALLAAGARAATAAAAAEAPALGLAGALAADDECAAGAPSGECAASALQRRAQGLGEAATLHAAGAPGELCTRDSCHGLVRGRPCQCDSKCVQYGNCCANFAQACLGRPAVAAAASTACYHSDIKYSLDWAAQGESFFRDWTFVTEDPVHGAHQYTTREEALKQGVISASAAGAQLRVGPIRPPSYDGEASKRYSVNVHTNQAWDPHKGFLTVMKYKHLPNGCGLWPGFWTMNSNKVWPDGGELDILEYANEGPTSVAVHTAGSQCKLLRARVEECKPRGSVVVGNDMWDCETNYYVTDGHVKMGCIPPQKRSTGAQLSRRPGILAAEWTDTHVTAFYIPEAEIPQDLKDEKPDPSSWGKWVIASFYFESPCTAVGDQELILNIQLCGDLPGPGWATKSSCAATTGYHPAGLRCVAGVSEPKDCCTQFITSPRQEAQLRQNAYFDIDYIKVFTPDGLTGLASGTFLRGGASLQA